MAKNLVIVESPAKAKTINKILGKDYVVRASMGHVRDLPQKKLGVDVENGFEPEYVTIKGRSKVLGELKTEARKADAIYLAPDPDREGEAIAWHLLHALAGKPEDDKFFRVTYNEITAPAIRAAFDSPSRIDMNRVNAQQARRVLDRIVGYQVSPLLWRRIRGSKSAGRVQSVALRLVCEREREIMNFKPDEYWLVGARVRKQVDPKNPFKIRLARIGEDKADRIDAGADKVNNIVGDLEGRKLVVADITDRVQTRKPNASFITSSLQQAASSAFGFTPTRTMRIAQTLYEGMDFGDGPIGLITYMRTDSVAIAKDAQDTCRAYIRRQFGDDFVPGKPTAYKSRDSAQEAHEAIRPTDVSRAPDTVKAMLKPDELKLYTLIWKRFVASQMAPARIAQRTYDVDARPVEDRHSDTPYLLRASTSEIIFPGYMRVMSLDAVKKTGDEEEDNVPTLEKGESLDCIEWLKDQKFTQPPPRYNEASLVRSLEENGVGRPSTFAQIISTILDREYVTKEKRVLTPTELGTKVNEFLVGNLTELFDIGFTAQMEASLDDIERGKVEWTGMLKTFYDSFTGWMEKTKGPAASNETVYALLDLFEPVKQWARPVTRGKKTYSDDEFVKSIRKQADEGKKAISARQVEALVKLVARYRAQLGADPAAKMKELGLDEPYAVATTPKAPPREETRRKFELLQGVTFDPPRTVGKKTYDDAEFLASLSQQVEDGKRLSPNQLRYLDRLVLKYADQIPDFASHAESIGLKAEQAGPDLESGPLIELLGKVTEWKEPQQRGKRVWDDQVFFKSLADQFEGKKSLSEKQRASLKKMCRRYADQIPDYKTHAEKLGLPLPIAKAGARKKTAKKTSTKVAEPATGAEVPVSRAAGE